MTALLLEISIFSVGDVCKIQSVSYDSKHISQSLSNTTFSAYTPNLKTTCHIRTLYISYDCSTSGEIYLLGLSCIQNTIGRVSFSRWQGMAHTIPWNSFTIPWIAGEVRQPFPELFEKVWKFVLYNIEWQKLKLHNKHSTMKLIGS